MYSVALLALVSAVPAVVAQTSSLTATLSGVLPVLPTPFTSVRTNQGAIIAADKLPFNPAVTPVGGVAAVQTAAADAVYEARLPAVAFNDMAGNITGTIRAVATRGQTGVNITISISGITNYTYGTYPYHIHQVQVPVVSQTSTGNSGSQAASGAQNCLQAGAHFDVTNAGELYMTNASFPQLIQTGDLAGKHGRIPNTTASYTTTYNDAYLSLDPASAYFFGNRSIVIHSNNSTRLACANFVRVNGTTTATGTATSAPTGATQTGATTSRPATFTGAASKALAGAGSIAAAVVAGLIAL